MCVDILMFRNEFEEFDDLIVFTIVYVKIFPIAIFTFICFHRDRVEQVGQLFTSQFLKEFPWQ